MDSEELRESYGRGWPKTEEAAYGYAEVYLRDRVNILEKRKTAFEMVKEFHETYGQPVGDEPKMLTTNRVDLRLDLIDEEVLEVKDAIDNFDLVNLAKELADLIYVVNGFAVELGIDLDAVVTEVHRSNMSKLGADGKPIYREDGKVLKGPDYFEADVETVLGL